MKKVKTVIDEYENENHNDNCGISFYYLVRR